MSDSERYDFFKGNESDDDINAVKKMENINNMKSSITNLQNELSYLKTVNKQLSEDCENLRISSNDIDKKIKDITKSFNEIK